MSATYPDLSSNFPDSIDIFPTWFNIVASDGPLIAQYQAAMESGNQTQANQILAQIPQGTQKIITATSLNDLTAAMLAVERFYKDNIADYIQTQQESWLNTINQFSYQGTWSNGTSYVTNNMVSYTTQGLTLLFIATSNPPLGTVPTNQTYWRVLTIQGQQGPSGPGLSYMQEWNNSTQYQENDAVTYAGVLWVALQSNQNIQPGTNSSYWQSVISFEATTYPIQDTEPLNQDVGGLWFNTQNNPTQYYYLETLDNPITQNMIPVGYQTYGAEGVVLNGTGPLPIVSGGTNATTSQNALANLGAGVRPNLLDNWYFVGGGSQQGGGQFPINQRGQTSYAARDYGIDRWALDNDIEASLSSDYVLLDFNKSGHSFFQKIERNLSGTHLTFSVLHSSNIRLTITIMEGSSVNHLANKTFNVTSGISLSVVDADIPEISATQRLCVRIYSPESNYQIKVYAAKLELGSHQTLAYQDESGAWQLFETPDYAEELAKCQSCLLPIPDGTVRFPSVQLTSNIIDFTLPISTLMRILPSLTGNTFGIFKVNEDGTTSAIQEKGFTFSLTDMISGAVNIRALKNSHGLSRAIICVPSGTAYLSAEL